MTEKELHGQWGLIRSASGALQVVRVSQENYPFVVMTWCPINRTRAKQLRVLSMTDSQCRRLAEQIMEIGQPIGLAKRKAEKIRVLVPAAIEKILIGV